MAALVGLQSMAGIAFQQSSISNSSSSLQAHKLPQQWSGRAWAPLRVSAVTTPLQFPGLEYQSSEKMLRAGERHKLDLQKVADAFKTHEGDSGSVQVQVSLLTAKIKYLSDHLKVHKKDFASRRGLKAMIARRKKLLQYLRSEDDADYLGLVKKLGIRELKN